MRKQRDRHTKAGPMGSGLLHFGERRKRKGGGGKGRSFSAAAGIETEFYGIFAFQITVL